jgi:hypothetical protein
MSTPPSHRAPVLDVAIIGAGASGAYSAYRLLSTRPRESGAVDALLARSGKERLDVQVFEGSQRVGGRLWSHQFPQIPGVVADLGGQGFSMTHQSVYGLCEHLGIAIAPFLPYNNPEIQYLRRSRFGSEAYDDKAAYPQTVRFFVDDPQKQNPSNLFTDTACAQLPGLKEAYGAVVVAAETGDLDLVAGAANHLTAFLREARISLPGSERPRPIWEYGVWNAMLDPLDIEGYAMVSTSFYSQTFFRNFNLYDQLNGYLAGSFPYFLPPPKFGFFHPSAGYQTLPETLLTAVSVTPRFDHRLKNLEKLEEGGETLVRLTFTVGGIETTVLARNVILAMPPRALQLLDPHHNVLYASPVFQRYVGSVYGDPFIKIFTVYDKAWWHKPHAPDQLMTGYSVTDYPLGPCYYIGQAENGGGLLNASLSDGTSAEYWEGLARGRDYGPGHRPLFDWYGAAPAALTETLTLDSALPLEFHLTPEMRAEVRRQLELMHGYPVPESIDGAYVNWSMNPYGGGVHFWYPGLESWRVMPQIRKPVDGCNIFICGEAFSASQGWAEGAINTAEKLLEEHFGLARPSWVTPHYSFGP